MIILNNGKLCSKRQRAKNTGEKMIKKYEAPELELRYFTDEDVLTESEESIFPGDGWVKDPFAKE